MQSLLPSLSWSGITTAFNLTYPLPNSTITVYPDSNFTFRWTSLPSDPSEVNITIEANTRKGNPQQLCTNVTTSTDSCTVQGQSFDFDNGPGWEAVVKNSADPGDPDIPGSGDVVFKSQPFALYLFGSSTSTAGTSASATTLRTATASGEAANAKQDTICAIVAGIAAILL